MKKHQRILIIGNSGSGKTWLGKALSEKKGLPLFHMDSIRWQKGEFLVRRSAIDIEEDLNFIKKQDDWILEGVFGRMAQDCISFVTLLVWLDLPWEDCKKNLLVRGPQFKDCLRPSEKEKALANLIDWASGHWDRKDPTSWNFFNDLYTNFQGNKVCLRHREEVTMFCNI